MSIIPNKLRSLLIAAGVFVAILCVIVSLSPEMFEQADSEFETLNLTFEIWPSKSGFSLVTKLF